VKTLNEDGLLMSPAARSYDINEMLGTKTRALMQRDQGRDLFDLFHAWEEGVSGRTAYKVDGAKAMAAFAWYLEKEGVVIERDEANAYLDQRLQNRSFRNDMNSLLRPGAAPFDVDAAAATVREAYFSHLP
jgi:predicted nucleotidyltransferase component of viral defense system